MTDDEVEQLVAVIATKHDRKSSWHGYPTDLGWLRDLIREAVDMALMTERSGEPLDEMFERQTILDALEGTKHVAAWPPPPNVTLTPIRNKIIFPPTPGPGQPWPTVIRTNDPVAWWDARIADREARWPTWTGLTHFGGHPFHTVKRPKPRHKCWAQTEGTNSSGVFMELCPCGGWRMDRIGDWMDRNTRPEERK